MSLQTIEALGILQAFADSLFLSNPINVLESEFPDIENPQTSVIDPYIVLPSQSTNSQKEVNAELPNIATNEANVPRPMTQVTANNSSSSDTSTIDEGSSELLEWQVNDDLDKSRLDEIIPNEALGDHSAESQFLKFASHNSTSSFENLKLNWLEQYEYVDELPVPYDESSLELSFIGPLSWIGAMKTDFFVRYIYLYGTENTAAQYNKFLLNVDRRYKLGYKYLMKFQYLNLKWIPRTDTPVNMEVNTITETGNNSGNGTRSSCSEKFKNLVPPNTAILNTFFTEIYPFVPVLDQTSLTENITRILSNQTSETFFSESGDDCVYISIFLLIVKLVEVDEILKSGDEDFDIDMGDSFEVEATEIARRCAQQLIVNDSVNILLLQLIILLRFFYRYAFHLGDSLDKGLRELYSTITYKISQTLGLNQDPDMNPFLSESDKHLLRKIWYTLRLMDSSDFATMSTPILNDLGNSVEVPAAKYANVEDKQLEQVSCSVFENSHIYDLIYTKINEMTLSSTETFQLTKMNGLINEFRTVLEKDLARDLTGKNGEFWLNIGFQKYLNMYGVLLSTLMTFNSYCCKKCDYARGARLNLIISKLIHSKLLPLISSYLSSNNFKFLKGSFTVLPLVNLVLNLVMIFYLSMISKIKLILLELLESEKSINNLYFRNLVVFQDLIYKSCGLVLNNYMGKLSRYYYTGWNAKHTFKYYLEQVEQSQVFRKTFEPQLVPSQGQGDIFERTGLKDTENIADLQNSIYGTITELAYKWEFPSGNSEFVKQFGDNLREACADDSILKELGGTKVTFVETPMEKGEFNKVDVNELQTIFGLG